MSISKKICKKYLQDKFESTASSAQLKHKNDGQDRPTLAVVTMAFYEGIASVVTSSEQHF